MPFHIQYFTRDKIDIQKWNRCIDNVSNGLIYAYSYYLDAMCTHWSGLVLNDYEAVMPLPWRRKWNIHYLYQPPFIAQLGLFGNSLTADLLQAFLQMVPKKFRYLDYMLNHKNVYSIPLFPLYERSNYVLDLSRSYQTLYAGYRSNAKRNVKKAEDYSCYLEKDVPVENIIHLARQQTVQAQISDEGFNRFQPLFYFLQKENKAVSYGVYSSANELIASAAFLFSHHRAYYILVGNHPNGRTLGASHKLIDAFIADYAGSNILLDFEGSDVRNVAFFYSSFGAVEEKYAALKWNRLPWFLKWLKN